MKYDTGETVLCNNGACRGEAVAFHGAGRLLILACAKCRPSSERTFGCRFSPVESASFAVRDNARIAREGEP